MTEGLEQIISERKSYSDEPVCIEVNGKKEYFLSDKAMFENLEEMYVDKLRANTAVTLGLDYEATTPGVVGVDCGSWLLDKIKITKDAFAVGVDYAQQMCVPESLELAMHMLRSDDAPVGLVTDLVPAYNQRVSAVACHYKNFFTPEYPMDRKFAGWCHSHAYMNVFHSSDDDANVLEKLKREELTIPETTINYYPSLVLNALGEYHGAMGLRWELDGCEKKIVDDIPVKFVDEPWETIKYDFLEFRKENITGGTYGVYKIRGRAQEDSKLARSRTSY